jgi:1-acyl-sn-glycerol-3-phosphate acyltransferase
MPAETAARWALAAYALIFAGTVLWRALTCPQGWRLWLLYIIDSLYCRLCFHLRANRPCPFLDVAPAILIANHRSVVDPGMLWAGMTNRRPLEFLTAQEYFGFPGLRFIFKALRSIPVERDGKDMTATRIALRRLKEGRIVGVFPEGRINTGPGLLQGDTGIAWLALHSRAPVYPAFIHNAPQGQTMLSSLYTFTRVRITWGDPVDLSAYYGRRITSELVREVTDFIMARLALLGGIAPRQEPAPEVGQEPVVLPMPNAG